jgi:hypothetical protein
VLVACGIDPGVCTGIAIMQWTEPGAGLISKRPVRMNLVQCAHASAADVLDALLRGVEYPEGGTRRVAQIEKFVTGNRAGSKGEEADVVRELIPELTHVLEAHGYRVKERPAADVKPWASEKRLAAAGVPIMKTKLKDATDAARHAIFCAVRDGHAKDPLA